MWHKIQSTEQLEINNYDYLNFQDLLDVKNNQTHHALSERAVPSPVNHPSRKEYVPHP